MVWSNPEAVTINGYTGPEQDPWIVPASIAGNTGMLLFDNHSGVTNVPFYMFLATQTDYKTFTLVGAQPTGRGNLAGVNYATANTNPVLDTNGNFYFTTGEFVNETRSTIYQGRWGPETVPVIRCIGPTLGIVDPRPGWVTQQVMPTADGKKIVYAETFLPTPGVGFMTEATRDRGFTPNPNASAIYANINAVSQSVYNGFMTPDQLTLYFTAAFDFPNGPHLYFATRATPTSNWGVPTLIVAAGDVVENGSLSLDGHHLYYHRILGPQEQNSQIYVLTGP